MDPVVPKAKTFKFSAPARIDLAGGTLDLWPLFLYSQGATVVNMAIQVFAKAEISVTQKSKKNLNSPSFRITSDDLKVSQDYSSLAELGESLNQTPAQNPLRWVNRVVFEVLKSQKENKKLFWEIKTSSDAPPGSGLGGSSVLGVALVQALFKATRKPLPKTEIQKLNLQQWVRDLEAQEIEHPAGEQDYIPALFGGLIAFHLNTHHRSVKKLPLQVGKKLSKHLALLYTGKPHHSGLNNWNVFKAFHEKDPIVKNSLLRIGEISRDLAGRLLKPDAKDWSLNIPELINYEWGERQKLSPAICPPVLKQAWDWAESLGAEARKACGAGGGGCMLFYFSDPAKKIKAIATTPPDSSWKWLSTQISP